MIRSLFDPEVAEVVEQARKAQERTVRIGDRDVAIQTPYPSPADWRDQWVYFILVDRFNNPDQPPKHQPWDESINTYQGGTFNGIRDKLDYLKEMGVGAIWLSPILKNCQYDKYSYHGYGIQNFITAEPRFSSDPERARRDPDFADGELRELIDQAHARGIYVIFDVILNHAGNVFVYQQFGGTAPWSDKAYPIYWRDETGQPRPEWSEPPENPHYDAAVFPDELRVNRYFRRQGMGGEKAGDFFSLKEFVDGLQDSNPKGGVIYPVQDALIRAYEYVIAKFDVDGFRIDTLKYITAEFGVRFAVAIREFAHSLGKNHFYMVGEVYDNEDKIVQYIGRDLSRPGDLYGVDAALDYPLYYVLPGVVKGMLPPASVTEMFNYRADVQRTLMNVRGEARNYFITFLDNHDQFRRFYFCDPKNPHAYDDQMELALIILFTLQGIPCIYYGTEQGLCGGGDSEESTREALWGKPEAFNQNHPFYQMIKYLSILYKSQPILRYGRQFFRPISGDGHTYGISNTPHGILAYSRLLSNQEVVIVANTSTTNEWAGEVMVDFDHNPEGTPFTILFSNKFPDPVDNPCPVVEKQPGTVDVRTDEGIITKGPLRSIHVCLQPMEVQVLLNQPVAGPVKNDQTPTQ